MTRQDSNLKILAKLLQYFVDNPDIRFHQALFNLGINEFSKESTISQQEGINTKYNLRDKYNEESSIRLKNIKS